MKKKKSKKRSPSLWYKQDPSDPKQLILRNGTRIRKGDDDVGLYITTGMRVYGLTRYGLQIRIIDKRKKKNYGRKILTGRGHHQGQNYPSVSWKNKKYLAHVLMAKAWKGGIPKGMAADHIDGNIYDFRYENIRVIDIPENNRCGGILKRLRNLAKERNDPSLLPVNIDNKDLLEIFERTKCTKGTRNRRKRREMFLRTVEWYLGSQNKNNTDKHTSRY